MEIDKTYACVRCGLSSDASGLDHLSSCPSYGSSDCPVTMGYEDGPQCESCRSEERYESLSYVLGFRWR